MVSVYPVYQVYHVYAEGTLTISSKTHVHQEESHELSGHRRASTVVLLPSICGVLHYTNRSTALTALPQFTSQSVYLNNYETQYLLVQKYFEDGLKRK